MEKSRIGKEWGKEFMAQHAILRVEKHKGNPARPLEAHHERQKEQYASNPDIDTSRSKYNFHIVKPEGRYYHFIQSRIEQAGCRTRKDSTRFVDTLITASPEFFKGKSPKAIQAFFQRAADFLIGRVGRQPGEFDEVAGRFSRLYGGEVPGLGAWGECQQDRPEAYPHPAFQTGGQPLQTGEGD
ncbi:plasmid recombination enzyme [[Clostridium] symbiosum ATCC 14940]|uniref:Plasmid recombination enzyme n=1 Tax=[Clostridium] symbiosum ATCC 14940 TaxID=411472 RepID=A0ABC9TT32_CLOSY|nr:plasmid recombination enzyme [[Clostridium] symbiosum ATCC 14940]